MIYTTQEFKEGDRVAYVPLHAEDDLTHKDVEQGFITSINHLYIFVRFDNKVTSQACQPSSIVKIDNEPTTTQSN